MVYVPRIDQIGFECTHLQNPSTLETPTRILHIFGGMGGWGAAYKNDQTQAFCTNFLKMRKEIHIGKHNPRKVRHPSQTQEQQLICAQPIYESKTSQEGRVHGTLNFPHQWYGYPELTNLDFGAHLHKIHQLWKL